MLSFGSRSEETDWYDVTIVEALKKTTLQKRVEVK